jgi:hypothetical protein
MEKNKFSNVYHEFSITETSKKLGISPRTVVRWAKNFNLSKKEKIKNSQPTDVQNQIIIGSLLGDGSLSKKNEDGLRGLSGFEELHSLKQFNWIKWKFDQLCPLSSKFSYKETTGRKMVNNRIINDENKICQAYRLRTCKNNYFSNLENLWYKRNESGKYIYKVVNGKNYRIKILPNCLDLTPLILAVWYFDDGSNHHYYAKLSTQSFNLKELKFLLIKLSDIGLKNCVIRKHSTGNVIIVKKPAYNMLIELVKKTLPTNLLDYKL